MVGAERKTLLVVDDEPQNVQILTSFLGETYRVRVATTGERALTMMAGPKLPDLVLLDVMMPGLDGYEVCRLLKAESRTAEVPVIFITGRTDADDETTGFSVGAVDYIHKPFNPVIVTARVRTQLALRETQLAERAAREEANRLLHVLLPSAAADEIQETGAVRPRRYDSVAVLFCDVVGFTSYCDSHQPEDIVNHLGELFVAFEEISLRHGIEKIKTIGDAYMGAANLLEPHADPLAAAVRCGLEMAAAVEALEVPWTVRVGVHVGPVVAGVVGQARYQFDIWGDTVNVAARMAGAGQAGAVAMTEGCWQALEGRFFGEELGPRSVKGKGTIPLYQALGECVSKARLAG